MPPGCKSPGRVRQRPREHAANMANTILTNSSRRLAERTVVQGTWSKWSIDGTAATRSISRVAIDLFDPDGDARGRLPRNLVADRAREDRRSPAQFWTGYARSPKLAAADRRSQDRRAGRSACIPYVEAKLCRARRPRDGSRSAGDYVAAATDAGMPLTTLFAGIAAAAALTQQVIARQTRRRSRAAAAGSTAALTRVTVLEVDIFAAHYDRLCARRRARAPQRPGRRVQQGNRQRRRAHRDAAAARSAPRPPTPAPPRAACSARPAKSPPPPSNRRWRCARPRRPPPA